MNRHEALKLLKENVSKENMLKHMYAVEAIMEGVAKYFNEDAEKWKLLGLLHDIDFEKAPEPNKHCTVAPEILKEKFDETFHLTLLKRVKEKVEDFSHTEETIYKSCGMPTRFNICFSTGKNPSIEVKNLEDIYKKEFKNKAVKA